MRAAASPHAMPQSSALDPDAIAALKAVSPDDGGAFLNELIGIFLADTPQRLAEIRDCLGKGDATTLTRAAHSIKGAAGNFGARRLAAAAYQIEQQGKTVNLAAIPPLLPALDAEFAAVKAEMEALRVS
ncbi:MAG: hypothetical protein C0502_05220 [Opitutus sp.]|nr:hypothetical protein [Opitutus sp.]